MMRHHFLLFLFIFTKSVLLSGQADKFATIDLHPVSPSAFQFTKYSEMPVSEHTGIPAISIPLYEINEDGVRVPVELSYHAVGVKVSQEASWVGLGWDMTFGSIVQIINDKDDYGVIDPSQIPYTKRKPDYTFAGGSPHEFPKRWKYPCMGSQYNGTGWSSPVTIPPVDRLHSWKIATDYYVPVSGQFDVQETAMFTYENYDSEPDIFTANFLGHSIKFIRNYGLPDTIKVLNKKGYIVSRIDSVWKIITPTGDQFFFTERSIIKSQVSSNAITGPYGTGYEVSSIIWYLTKVVTNNKKEIKFFYTRTAETEGFPSYSDKLQIFTDTTTLQTHFGDLYACGEVYHSGEFSTNYGHGTFKTYSISKEQYIYLDSIVYPNGRVDFKLSNRTDMNSAKKIDKIQILSKLGDPVNVFNLNYSYFDSTSSAGNYFIAPFGAQNGTIASQRLKLLSVSDSTGNQYIFSYNTTPLPRKRSFAQDFWGFYNGADTNTSLVPNPALFGHSEMGDTTNDRSARLTYTKAGILEQIQYPTGGKAVFEYELNKFNNYWIPDSNSTSNTISTGNGLRIKTISHYTDSDKLATKTRYSYGIGKDLHYKVLYRSFSYSFFRIWQSYVIQDNFTVGEISSNGSYSPSPFASINGVAYDTVTKEQIDLVNNTNGKTISYFHNNPDVVNTSASSAYIHATLPTIKAPYPENGLLKKQEFYNDQNTLQRKVTYNYSIDTSAAYYGARIFPYYVILYGNGDYLNPYYLIKPRNLIGYYPVFDFQTLLISSNSTDYLNGDSISITIANEYDELNRLKNVTKTGSSSDERIAYGYPIFGGGTGVISEMFQANRLMDVVSYRKYREWPLSNKAIEATENVYRKQNGIFLKDKTIVKDPYPYDVTLYEIIYDNYDTTNGNLLQFTSKKLTNSFIWDYDKKYVIAEISNASLTDVAHTSFEADGSGYWFHMSTVTTDATSPTGNKCLYLNNEATTVFSLTQSKTYKLSYWVKSGSSIGVQDVTPTSQITGQTINGWTYKECEVTGTEQVSLNGTGYVDELRLYPKVSQMKTYTYKPLVGITTECDANSKILRYEYDSFNRLKVIKDGEGKIIKQFEYKFRAGIND